MAKTFCLNKFSLFKKRFSGECTNSDGLKSTDILKGKNDVDKNFDWNVCVNDLDEFNEDIEAYVKKNKNSEGRKKWQVNGNL